MEEKQTKVVKSYSLRPEQIAWLRKQALNESTEDKTVSASAVLERIVDEAISSNSPTPGKQKKTRVAFEAITA